MLLKFQDSLSNPLPAAIKVTVKSGTTTIGSSYLGVGGSCLTDIPVVTGTSYTASFFGEHAPSETTTFTAPSSASTPVTVADYFSPDQTAANYASTQIGAWPSGWFSDTAKTTGGNAYNVALAAGTYMENVDEQWQEVALFERLQSCTSTDIDSWVADFFGTSLPRFDGETDANYITRAMANLQADKSTAAGMAKIAAFFGSGVWISEPWNPDETGGCDSVSLACDTPGGEVGDQSPFVRVWLDSNGEVPTSQLKSTIAATKPAGMNYEVVNFSGSNGTVL